MAIPPKCPAVMEETMPDIDVTPPGFDLQDCADALTVLVCGKLPSRHPNSVFALQTSGARCIRCRSFCTVNCGEQGILHRLQIIKPRHTLCKSCAERQGYDQDFYDAVLELEAM